MVFEEFTSRMLRYSVIYADPPWTYRDRMTAGKRGVAFKYPTMPLEDIKQLPVQNITAPDAALILWCTAPQLPAGLDVMSSWGFTFKTVAFTWVKLNKKAHIHGYLGGVYEGDRLPGYITPSARGGSSHDIYTDFMGMGTWTRSNTEVCLLGTIGSPKRVSAGVRQLVMTPREEQHSKKPDIVRDKIVELFGDIPRIELFARQYVDGWCAWGDEIIPKVD